MVRGETDFRLIDRIVADAFISLPERERMTRSLINWLGFKNELVKFKSPARRYGSAQYSTTKLFHLAVYSFVTNSLKPLRLAGYIGLAITFFSGLLGLIVLVNKYMFGDPFGWNITGTAQLAIINVFLVGVVLMVLGVMSLYIGNINNEVVGRPLYVVRKRINF
jgi:dolichol-phosphate mannosyltransferase